MPEMTKTIRVTIDSNQFTDLLVAALFGHARSAADGEYTCFRALGCLVGVSDVEAVRMANKEAKITGHPTITVAEFRKWLPALLSSIFEEWHHG